MGEPDGWTVHTDPTSGKQFYYNATTGETSWDRPTSSANGPETALREGWVEHIDPASGKAFYCKTATGETSWEKPSLDKNEAKTAGTGVQSLPEGWTEHIDPSSGKAFYYKQATGETMWEKPKIDSTSSESDSCLLDGWAPHVDAESGRTFYYNAELGTTSWDKPEKVSVTWSTNQAHDLGKQFSSDGLQQKVRVLEKVSWTSVSKTVQALNQGVLVVDFGLCVAFSRSQDSYWLLWRADKVEEALRIIRDWKTRAASTLPDGWAEHVDPTSGNIFYYNAATGETSWEKPQYQEKEQLKIFTKSEKLQVADDPERELDFRDQESRQSMRRNSLKKKSAW